MNLAALSEPFPVDDIEWRVSRSGVGKSGIFCMVLAYVTNRAVQNRLDSVCGPENWRVEEPRIIDVNGKSAFAVGIAIRSGDEWLTKWDVAEPTAIEPAKGGFSGAMKRAASQWGIGRYLYYLDEHFAEVSENPPTVKSPHWHYAKLPQKHGGASYYWKTPELPGWAIPKEPEHEITSDELNQLKKAWKETAGVDSPKALREGFKRFVTSIVGEFPLEDRACWTRDAWDKCMSQVGETVATGVSSDVPFE